MTYTRTIPAVSPSSPPRGAAIIRNAQPAPTGYVGLTALVCCFALARADIAFTGAAGFLQTCIVMFIAMATWDVVIYRVHRQPDVGSLTWDRPLSRLSLTLLGNKTVGVAVSAGVAFITYTVFPLYQDAWYQGTFALLMDWAPLMIPVFALYIAGFHFATQDRNDALAQFGRFCLTLGRDGDRSRVRDHLLGLAIKVFFIPLMVGFGLTDWGRLSAMTLTVNDFRSFYEIAYQLLLLTDVCFGVIGYFCSFRLLGAHVRCPERSPGGWLFCLICYVPFWQVINQNFLTYSDGIVWGTVFADNSLPYVVWGSAILLLMTVYVLSTVSFGYRFSNLTYRGVVCSGPYKFMRHPAYVSKNLSYWMIELPVIGATFASAASGTLALVLVNVIYFMRARYEERCCLQHEDYRIYHARLEQRRWL